MVSIEQILKKKDIYNARDTGKLHECGMIGQERYEIQKNLNGTFEK